MGTRKNFSPEQKVIILKKHILEGVALSNLYVRTYFRKATGTNVSVKVLLVINQEKPIMKVNGKI